MGVVSCFLVLARRISVTLSRWMAPSLERNLPRGHTDNTRCPCLGSHFGSCLADSWLIASADVRDIVAVGDRRSVD